MLGAAVEVIGISQEKRCEEADATQNHKEDGSFNETEGMR